VFAVGKKKSVKHITTGKTPPELNEQGIANPGSPKAMKAMTLQRLSRESMARVLSARRNFPDQGRVTFEDCLKSILDKAGV
jgi:hypothetical protein